MVSNLVPTRHWTRLWTMLLAVLAGAAVAAARQMPSPKPPAGDGAISGVVVDGSTGAPVANAIVAINGGTFAPDYQRRQLTDAKGRFVFARLADSDAYTISVAKLGCLDGGYGREGAPTDPLRPIVVRNGAWIPNVRAMLWRPSTISGIVRDEAGEPVVGVLVRVLARVRVSGREMLAAGPLAVTDDRGSYRIAGLMAGRFIVQVPSVQMSVPAATRTSTPSRNTANGVIEVDDTTKLAIGGYPIPPPRTDGRVMSYGPAYHPAETALAQATTIDLAFGEEHPGVDVTLTPVPTTRVSGIVEAPPDVLANVTLRLIPAGLEDLGFGGDVATALVAADGTFSFVNVPPGAYTIDAPMTFNELTVPSGATSSGGSVGFGGGAALPPLPNASGTSWSSTVIESFPGASFSATDFRNGDAPKYFGRVSVTAGGSPVNGVTLRLRPAGTLRGSIVLETDPTKPAPQSPATPPRFRVILEPAGGQARFGMPASTASAVAGGEFEIPGVQSGEYCLRVFGAGVVVKSVQWRGRDFTNAPLDTSATDDLSGVVVTVTEAVPTLAGTVRVPGGTGPDGGLVVAFPVDPVLRSNAGYSPQRVKSTAILQSGGFTFTTLPAGDYFVAAIDRTLASKWRDPDVMSALERQASRVTLAWGRTTNQDLTMAAAR